MATKQGLIQRHNKLVDYAKRKGSPYGSIPSPLFIGNKFNLKNWNGGDAVIRQFTFNLEKSDHNSYVKEFEWKYKSGDLIANWDYFNDQNYVQITLRVYDDRVEEWGYEQFLITYYKRRGAIDLIRKNGKTITLDEYVELLNIIESTGFRFDMSI